MNNKSINTSRQPEVDLAKAVLIFCLAPVHTVIECSSDEVLSTGFGFFFDSVLGGPLGAPMFMFAMGMAYVFTKNQQPSHFFSRGILLLRNGFILNLVRFLIPLLIGFLITKDAETYLEPIPYRVFECDIMQFAALAMLLMGLFKKLKLSDGVIFFTALIMRIAAELLNGIDFNNQVLNVLLGHVMGTEDTTGMVFSYFPLLNWFIVPVSGYLFEKRILQCEDKSKLYRVVSPIGIILSMAWFVSGIIQRRGMFGEGQNCYYHISIMDVSASIAAAAGMLGAYYVITLHFSDRARLITQKISSAINTVYCVQWIIVIWGIDLILYCVRKSRLLPIYYSMPLGFIFSVLSVGIALAVRSHKGEKR